MCINMRPIFMHIDSLRPLAIDIPAQLGAFVNNKTLLASLFRKISERSAKQAGADNKIIVRRHAELHLISYGYGYSFSMTAKSSGRTHKQPPNAS